MYNDDETTVLYENEKQQSKSDNTHDDDVRPYIDGKEDRSSLNKDTTEEVSHNADNDTRDKRSKRLLLSCMLSINIIYTVKHVHVVTSIKQSSVLEGDIFLVLS